LIRSATPTPTANVTASLFVIVETSPFGPNAGPNNPPPPKTFVSLGAAEIWTTLTTICAGRTTKTTILKSVTACRQ
jgi:hypothetical protein